MFVSSNILTNSLYSVVWHPLMLKDVENHWAKDAVNDMGSRLIVNGIGNDLYNPNTDMTRAEFAAIMMKGLGLKPVDGKAPFADVDAPAWYHSAVAASIEAGVISGRGAHELASKANITRAEVAAIVQRILKASDLI